MFKPLGLWVFAYNCKAKYRLSISNKSSKLRCTVTDTLDFQASYEEKNFIFNENIFDFLGFKNVIKMKTKKSKGSQWRSLSWVITQWKMY